MIFEYVLVRYGEVTLKGRNRHRFENMMLERIQTALAAYPSLEYEKTFGRVLVRLHGISYEQVADRLKDIFGILSFSPVARADHELENIREAALELVTGLPEAPATFKVSAKRAWKGFPHSSPEMNHLVGSHVLRNMPALKVDVRNPAAELRIDIQYEGVFLYCRIDMGAGGFPYGMNGKAMLLLSGGIDSPVAGWMAMRKGLKLEAVHFHSYPYTSEQAKDKVVELARRLAYYAGEIKLHLVPFAEVQTRLVQAGRDNLTITLMRRCMLRIAERLAQRHGALAVVTGDSLGQVASQTLGSMNVIGRAGELPLLRPLVMMDKQEIIGHARSIGTFDTSILPFEDCCTLFVPKSPAINPNLLTVERLEQAMGEELERLLTEAADGTDTIVLRATGAAAAKVETPREDDAETDDWF